jgi:hypothetical protein
MCNGVAAAGWKTFANFPPVALLQGLARKHDTSFFSAQLLSYYYMYYYTTAVGRPNTANTKDLTCSVAVPHKKRGTVVANSSQQTVSRKKENNVI